MPKKKSFKPSSSDAGSSITPNERWWNSLLLKISEGKVVPVLGGGLLRVPVAESKGKLSGEPRCYFNELTEKLSEKWLIPVNPSWPAGRHRLHELVLAHQRAGRQEADGEEWLNLKLAYADVAEEASNLDFPVPETLKKIAAIRPFRTFLTTMFDGRVERAARDAKREVRKGAFVPELPAQSGPRKEDLLEAEFESDVVRSLLEGLNPKDTDCQIYHLLGTSEIASPHAFVIWDNDLLNWAVSLDTHCPPVLEKCLRDKHLLYLGLECDDWLTRFLLRIANRGPLETCVESNANYIADRGVNRDTLIYQFFDAFGPNRFKAVDLGEGGVESFIDELSRRWQQWEERTLVRKEEMERKKSVYLPPKTVPRCTLPGDKLPDGDFVFISYSRQDDLRLAKEVRGVLESIEGSDGVRIESWFDMEQTKAGEDWRVLVRDGIDRCRYFLAIISKEALARKQKHYYGEWRRAKTRADETMKTGEVFCLALLTPDADPKDLAVKEHFNEKTRMRVKPDHSWDEFKERMIELWERPKS